MIQYAGDIPFEALEPVHLSWLTPYGHVFSVLDKQRSGNLCYGTDGPWGKLFIKHAGIRTLYGIQPEKAAAALREAVTYYQDPPDGLVRLVTHGPVNGGREYAAIFEWAGGMNLGDAKNLKKARQMPLINKLQAIDDILSLHAKLEDRSLCSFVYDDSHLFIDPATGHATVCDIDDYTIPPIPEGDRRIPGNSMFCAPEEAVTGQLIDFRTTVYRMGMTAFLLLGDPEKQDPGTWKAPDRLYPLARRAVDPKKSERFASVNVFLKAWRDTIRFCRFEE